MNRLRVDIRRPFFERSELRGRGCVEMKEMERFKSQDFHVMNTDRLFMFDSREKKLEEKKYLTQLEVL